MSGLSCHKRDMIFDNKGVWLIPIPKFPNKTQAASIDPKPFHILKHDIFSSRHGKDRLLCPILMLKYYLSFTNGHAKECDGEGAVCLKLFHRG